MGGCQSLHYEDDDERIMRIRSQQHAREMREFQNQLRRMQCFSEMDLTGKPRKKKEPTKEQIIKATNIIYDA